MFIDGIALAGYRSFGPTIQRIGPLRKINFLVGPNNSGKSNVLRFLHRHYHDAREACSSREKVTSFHLPLDAHKYAEDFKPVFGVALTPGSQAYEAIVEQILEKTPGPGIDFDRRSQFDHVLGSDSLSRGTTTAWFDYHCRSLDDTWSFDASVHDAIYQEEFFTNRDWKRMAIGLFSPPDRYHDVVIPGIVNELNPISTEVPPVYFIPAIRKIEAGDFSVNELSGKGLIGHFAKLQAPSFSEDDKRAAFEKINSFVQSIIGRSDARIHIPHETGTIEVIINETPLPLDSLGSGIHELVILATAATAVEDSVVCIEEPEIHMHPVLQRKLISYLNENTSNQYVISTHSAHMLDIKGAEAFHLKLEDGQTIVDHIISPQQRFEACYDLGYRASDLVQTNCVIWVEGPSDRIYIRRWLQLADPDLVEGLHYSIMFYGGRLLNHLSADDLEVDDFISLRKLNRFVAVVIDSDITHAGGEINQTKSRIQKEILDHGGLVWITRGREIENYVDMALVRETSQLLSPGVKVTGHPRYGKLLEVQKPDSEQTKTLDKIKFARKVVENTDLSRFDLEERIEELRQFIRKANPDL